VEYGKSLYFTRNYNAAITQFSNAREFVDNTVLQTGLGNAFEANGDFSLAESCYVKASYMVPSSFYNKYLLFQLYKKTGQFDNAKGIGKVILNMDVKVQSPAINTIKSEVRSILRFYGQIPE
jgi:O-antigen polymerase